MAEECKFFLGESGQFKFVPSDSTLQDSSSQVEIKKDLLDLDYRKHMEPYISGQTPAAGSVVCYPDITTEAQVNTKKEFEELKTYEDSVIIPNKSFKESQKEANSCCNRYVNVLPCKKNKKQTKKTSHYFLRYEKEGEHVTSHTLFIF